MHQSMKSPGGGGPGNAGIAPQSPLMNAGVGAKLCPRYRGNNLICGGRRYVYRGCAPSLRLLTIIAPGSLCGDYRFHAQISRTAENNTKKTKSYDGIGPEWHWRAKIYVFSFQVGQPVGPKPKVKIFKRRGSAHLMTLVGTVKTLLIPSKCRRSPFSSLRYPD